MFVNVSHHKLFGNLLIQIIRDSLGDYKQWKRVKICMARNDIPLIRVNKWQGDRGSMFLEDLILEVEGPCF